MTGVACLAATCAMGFSLAAEQPAAAEAMRLAREGAAAAEAKDYATYLARMEEAVALRPDFPRMLVNLAAARRIGLTIPASVIAQASEVIP